MTQEFEAVWRKVAEEQTQSGKSFEDEGTTEEAARADYRKIAERRVRLGLLLADIGERAAVKVPDEEVSQALVARARSFPGQEKMVWDYYQKNPAALAEIRAPLYEEKVVDHIVALVKVVDKKVSKEDLLALDEEEDEGRVGAGRRRRSGLIQRAGARSAPRKAPRAIYAMDEAQSIRRPRRRRSMSRPGYCECCGNHYLERVGVVQKIGLLLARLFAMNTLREF